MKPRGGWWRRLVPLVVCATSIGVAGVAVPSATAKPTDAKTVPVQQISNRVEKLIKIVENSTLACETRNAMVRKLRVFDDALLSGNRSAAQALVQAWRQHARSLEAARVIAPELGSSLLNQLRDLPDQIGFGWPAKPGPTRHWKPLPSCDTSVAGVASASGGLVGSGYTPQGGIDASASLETFIASLVGLVPYIGPMLAGIVWLLWPAGSTATDNNFQELVDQATYDRVESQLQGFMDLMTSPTVGWEKQVSDWHNDCANPPADKPTICVDEANKTLWPSFQSKIDNFTTDAGIFQQSGYELALLPLYAQYESLLMGFLRDGMMLHDQYWSKESGIDTGDLAGSQMAWDLDPAHTNRGVGYVTSVYQTNLAALPWYTTWDGRNAYVRDQTLRALDFRDTWKYMDPRAYPDGVPGGVKLTRMIWSDPVGDPMSTWDLPPTNVFGPLKEFSVWTRPVSGATPPISSMQSTNTPLLGPVQSGAVRGDTAQLLNAANYYDLSARGPITEVQGQTETIDNHGTPAAIRFGFATGSQSDVGTWSSTKQTQTFHYDGEVLANARLFIGYDLGTVTFADAVVFGFRSADSFNATGEAIGQQSGKCIGVPTFANDTQAVINSCNSPPSAAQTWTYDPGLQQISVTNPAEWSTNDPTITGKHCLDIAGGSTAAGAAAVVRTCDDGAYSATTGMSSQRWKVEAVAGDVAKITNVRSGLVLDVSNSSTADGALLVQEPYAAGDTSQQWQAHDPLTGEIHGIPSGRCVDVPAGSTVAGTQVQLYDCNGGTAQQWTYQPTNKELVYAKAPTMCLEARAGGTTSGTAVQINACTGASEQQWSLSGNGSRISNLKSGLVLDVGGGKIGSGSLVQLASYNGTQSQQWSRTSSQGGSLYGVGSAKCLDLAAWSNDSQALIFTCRVPPSGGQVWTYRPIAQAFTIQSPDGPKCLDTRGGAATENTAVVINDCTGAPSQRWLLDFTHLTIANVNSIKYNPDGTWSSVMVLGVGGGGTADWAAVQLTPLPLDGKGNVLTPASSQQWVWSLS